MAASSINLICCHDEFRLSHPRKPNGANWIKITDDANVTLLAHSERNTILKPVCLLIIQHKINWTIKDQVLSL